jgi:Protein of unknown function (DUF2442)
VITGFYHSPGIAADMIQFEGIFAPLKHPAEFLKVYVNPELGTICWPNGADLDPNVSMRRLLERK